MDEAGGGATATLNVGEGAITVVIGDSGVTIDSGNGSGTVVFDRARLPRSIACSMTTSTGTITYLNSSDTPSASTTFTVTVNDAGNTGTDPGLTGDGLGRRTNSQTINITATNDDPTNAGSLPTDIAVTKMSPATFDLSAIDLSDVDAAGGT